MVPRNFSVPLVAGVGKFCPGVRAGYARLTSSGGPPWGEAAVGSATSALPRAGREWPNRPGRLSCLCPIASRTPLPVTGEVRNRK